MPIHNLLKDTAHRPWPLPEKQWRYYQEWNSLLFLHWEADAAALEPFIPAGTTLDTFEGKAWLSIVPFTMQKIRPKFLPSFKPVSDFHEINVRTYVTKDGQPGVFFFSIEAQKAVSAFLSRKLSGMPYEKAHIVRAVGGNEHQYYANNANKQFRLNVAFSVEKANTAKTALDLFLTERYCVYITLDGLLYRYHVHHAPWPLHHITLKDLSLQYKAGHLSVTPDTPPALIHYSPGVKVVAWNKELA
ncbi:hypothetical protein SAMN05421788_101903 [Filimonas lacunae]|uniref:DUF2071 domain-containing protein n=1 Tax=Filimonas lacunae TaxID=477680 RepID=A0A173MQ53_9BACT|nr:DUF2071 domain-containing protein [Filimonas lacunae]BAV09468.1 hypothetical protein FLA_5517 [Filimonas lacunae]SIS73722.1 hypothetical protein SAMN05421788_101903 [Filimonas lacunae]